MGTYWWFNFSTETTIPFILSASLNLYAFYFRIAVFKGPFNFIFSLTPPILIALGGAIEGLFAETIFDQKIHALAVILFNLGFWLEFNMITKASIMLPNSCNNL